jgi:shikimate kinase
MSERRHLYLSGFMGAGKSTVGRRLAARLGRPFFDLDAQVEAAAGRSVAQLFDDVGEAGFRRLEAAALEAVAATPAPAVVALGGGTVLSPANRALMRATGTLIHLAAQPHTLQARLGDGGGRPLLARASVAELLAARAEAYADADVRVDTDDLGPDAVCDFLWVAVSAPPTGLTELRAL